MFFVRTGCMLCGCPCALRNNKKSMERAEALFHAFLF
ncbi:hypothetical protein N288_01100 [Bacillus infantis NRRL B-14911]|uniref:Uncharacterized protein n=1 Tax=Bacillus infantis NRRL B-14911 TaxID=1367477 RepID=U5L641_9BACI|nr:hypothetical protein N288_01100 [Bacillus infantis NRRL B-14911]